MENIKVLPKSSRAVIKPAHGSLEVIKKGQKAFNEPSLTAQSVFGEIPDFLADESFIFTNLASGLGFTATTSGSVLLLTEQRGEKLHWLHPEFGLSFRFKESYRKIADFENGTLLPNYDSALTLYELDCYEGMEFKSVIRPGQLCVIFAKLDENYTPLSAEDDDANCLELSTTPVIPLTGENIPRDYGYSPDKRGYQACPTIAITSEDTIYGAVMADPEGYTFLGGENHYCYVAVMRSRDGIVWEDPIAVFDPDGDGPARTFEPILWTSHDRKRIYLSYTQAAGTSSNVGGKVGTWITYTDNPEDPCPEWSTPIRVIDGMTDSKPFLATDGYWYWSTAFWALWHRRFFDESAPETRPGVHIYRSNNCLEWVHICDIPKTNWGIAEPTIIEANNGELLLIERTSGSTPLRKSSLKNPAVWTVPEPMRADMNNPESAQMNTVDSRNFFGVLPSGKMLFVFHNNDTRKRDTLTVALSEDGGVTWPYKLLIDERLHSTYPFVDVTSNGEILIIHDHGRIRPSNDGKGGGEILLARITEEDIMAGKLVTPKAVLKRMVNRYGMSPNEETITEQINASKRIMKICDEKQKNKLQEAIEILAIEKSSEKYLELCILSDSFIK
ncbi:MAG: exo-alpha-sialidase [Ruminococcaceae bacterium]|nr:exo-alpha-sialidase [Oscillospiraceae bacterium]